MTDFAKAAATALRLVEANGRAVVLFKVNRDPDDPARPWEGVSGAPTVPEDGEIVPAIVAFVPATGGGFGKMIQDADGTLNVAFEQVGLLASSSMPPGSDPEEFDSIRDGADLWKIVARGHLRPSTQSILFVLGLKR